MGQKVGGGLTCVGDDGSLWKRAEKRPHRFAKGYHFGHITKIVISKFGAAIQEPKLRELDFITLVLILHKGKNFALISLIFRKAILSPLLMRRSQVKLPSEGRVVLIGKVEVRL